MNKLPTKQIYLLTIIVVGIFSLSVYSTYSIFTLESVTNNIVKINTPNNILLNTETYEYKQVVVPKNYYTSVDVDLYNNTDNDLCYGIWYKVISNDLVDEHKVKIYENTKNSLTTSGVIDTITSKRVTLLIINDNDTDTKINIGMTYMTHETNSDSCQLNLTTNRKLISTTINSPQILSNSIIQKASTLNSEEGYLTYQNNEDKITISETKIFVSETFTYKEELFTLNNPQEININDLNNYVSNENTSYYTCIENDKCKYLYKINSIITENEEVSIDKYDTLIGYLAGESGLRKDENNYIFFGDNPHNFIYYNCKNEYDTTTCELWRIIGFYYSEKTNKYITKIIKDSSLGTYIYDNDTNLYIKSSLSNYLNKEYIINNNSITEILDSEENLITNEDESVIFSELSDKFKTKVTLMKLTDFLNTSVCQNKNLTNYEKNCLESNWLNKGINEFTMTIKYEKPSVDPETEEEVVPDNNIVYTVGTSINSSLVTEKNHVRPVIYLKERTMLLSGDGTIDNPYIIK